MRFALIAATSCLVLGIVTWNVAFDRAIQSAEQHYLALQRQHPGTVGIRQVMDPAIHGGAVDASAWAGVLTGAGVVVAFGIARRSRKR
jgi:hypothetical protein